MLLAYPKMRYSAMLYESMSRIPSPVWDLSTEHPPSPTTRFAFHGSDPGVLRQTWTL